MKDKYGIEIEEFDILKVYHFSGIRRKKYYMYKMAIIWKEKLYASHLNERENKPSYALWTGSENSEHYEIVQSNNWEKLS